MRIKVEEKPCTILLDSCSSASIVRESFLINYLNKDSSQAHGPRGCVKGIGNTITYDKGRIDLKLEILGRVYTEEFIIMNEPGIPGSILLSAEAMGRCGLDVNFRKRKIKSEDSKQEVTFSLEETRFSVNRARLQETGTSKQMELENRDLLNSRNNEKYHPRKIKYFYRRNKYNHKRSSALQNRIKHKVEKSSSSKSNSASKPKPKTNKKTKSTGSEPIDIGQGHEMQESSNRILKVMQQISQAEEANMIVTESENATNQSSLVEENECYSIKNKNGKTLTEVLHLGTITTENLTEKLASTDKDKQIPIEYTYFTNNHNSEKQIHCISTNDDYRVTFKIAQDTYLAPNYCSKVHLTVQDENLDIKNKNVISKMYRHTPEDLRMDDSLVKLNGINCITYVHNHTDKNIRLLPGQTL